MENNSPGNQALFIAKEVAHDLAYEDMTIYDTFMRMSDIIKKSTRW